LITRIIFGEGCKSLNSSLCSSPPPPCYFVPLKPNILLRTLFPNTLGLCTSLNVSDLVSHPYKTTDKIIILYILIFKFSDNKLEDRRDIWSTFLFHTVISLIFENAFYLSMFFSLQCICFQCVLTSRFKSSGMLLSVGVKFSDVSNDRWRPGSNPRSVHVEFVVDKVTLRQVFLRVLRVSPVTILFTHLSLMLCIVST
jgi:hypothetical protein